MRSRSLIDDLGIETYILNTGHLGGKDIGVTESVTLLREIARGTVGWTDDEASGLTVPRSVPGIDIGDFSVADNVTDHDTELSRLRTERQVHLDTFEELDEDIKDAVY